MSGVVSELVTRFGFEIDDKGLKELQEGIDSIKEGVLHLGEALVGEAVGLYELVVKASEAGVQLRIMTQETGLAAEKLQELQYRAKLADVSADEFGRSMNFLSRNMTQAKMGSEEARKNFRRLGISTAELRAGTVSVDTVLNRVSKTFERMPDGPTKTGLAMEIFGRGGARMVPMLNNLHSTLDPVNAELLRMSMITDEQIEASEQFHIQLETLKTGLLSMVRVIGFGLMPEATQIIQTMKKWIVQNRELIKTNLIDFVKGMTASLKITLAIVNALVESFTGFAHAIGGVKIMVELLLGGFAILSGVTVLFGIGKVIQAVYALAESFAIADAAAALIPVAIGAALVALLLIMEDIFSFFSGKDSFTGDLLKKIPEIGKVFKQVFEPIFAPLVSIMTMLTDGFGSWKDIFKELGILVVNLLLTPFRILAAQIGGIGSLLGRVTGLGLFKSIGEGGSKAADFLSLNSMASSPTGVTPQVAAGSTLAPQATKNDLSVHNEFNFPPGTDPTVVGDKISSSISDGLSDVLRYTSQTTSDGGQH